MDGNWRVGAGDARGVRERYEGGRSGYGEGGQVTVDKVHLVGVK